jgi:hypothetical protein
MNDELEGSSHGLSDESSWSLPGGTEKPSVRIAGVLAKIQTEHF